MPKNSKNGQPASSRWWCWTINNPTADDDKQLTDLCNNDNCLYLCYGKEKVNTPHYQGYVELNKPQRFAWIKKRLARSHIEPRKGSRTQARDYCFKEDRDPYEYGAWTPDRQGQRNDLIVVQKMLQEGVDMHEIHTEHFEASCKYNKFFDRYAADCAEIRNTPTKVSIYWGDTGTGKTRKAMEEPGAKQTYTLSDMESFNNRRGSGEAGAVRPGSPRGSALKSRDSITP